LTRRSSRLPLSSRTSVRLKVSIAQQQRMTVMLEAYRSRRSCAKGRVQLCRTLRPSFCQSRRSRRTRLPHEESASASVCTAASTIT
jgi:hypothetical protein